MCRVGGKLLKSLSECVDIGWRAKQTVDPVGDDLGRTARHRRPPPHGRRPSLRRSPGRRARAALRRARRRRPMRAGPDVVDVAGEAHLPADAELVGKLVQLALVALFAEQRPAGDDGLGSRRRRTRCANACRKTRCPFHGLRRPIITIRNGASIARAGSAPRTSCRHRSPGWRRRPRWRRRPEWRGWSRSWRSPPAAATAQAAGSGAPPGGAGSRERCGRGRATPPAPRPSRPATQPMTPAFSELVCTQVGPSPTQPGAQREDVSAAVAITVAGLTARAPTLILATCRSGPPSIGMTSVGMPRSASLSSSGPDSPRITVGFDASRWPAAAAPAPARHRRAWRSGRSRSPATWGAPRRPVRRRGRGPRRTPSPDPRHDGTGCGHPARALPQSLEHRLDERSAPRRTRTGVAQVAEAGHRRGHRRVAHRQALVGLDRVEALGERRHHVRDDHHVGVLEVAGHRRRTAGRRARARCRDGRARSTRRTRSSERRAPPAPSPDPVQRLGQTRSTKPTSSRSSWSVPT